METAAAAYGVGVPRQLIQLQYDYLGRRVRKTVANWNSGSSTYVAVLDRKFIYNGWNLIGEYDAGTALAMFSSYVWGLDLSGNLADGGGVGGLLAIKQAAGSLWHLPYYDANGNVHALVNRASGAVSAAYEYSPFGETLRAAGTYAAANSFRFSTKYADTETGLLYYGRRYYNPTLGRWLGRDPIEEKGGLHLYAFCGNNAVNRYDVLGNYSGRNPSALFWGICNGTINGGSLTSEEYDAWLSIWESANAPDGWLTQQNQPYDSNALANDGFSSATPSWRTARRRSMRCTGGFSTSRRTGYSAEVTTIKAKSRLERRSTRIPRRASPIRRMAQRPRRRLTFQTAAHRPIPLLSRQAAPTLQVLPQTKQKARYT